VAKRPPEPFVLFLGDVHAGSTVALAPEAQCRDAGQAALLAAYRVIIERAKKAAHRKSFCLMLGGDLVDGSRHHGTYETWGTPLEQRDGAVELLLPLANMAADIRALVGTEVHAGPKGDDDLSVARQLGAKTARTVWRMTIAGRRLFWTHHGISIPRDLNGAERALFTEAKRQFDQHKESLADIYEHEHEPHDPDELRPALIEPPHLVVHHHAHFSPRPVTAYGMTVAVCPCWQGTGMYGASIGPERVPTVGALAWWPAEHRVLRWRVPVENKYETLALA
jgi:hypothetical protein